MQRLIGTLERDAKLQAIAVPFAKRPQRFKMIPDVPPAISENFDGRNLQCEGKILEEFLVPFRLASIGRGPSRGWEMHVRELGMWVDDRRIEGTATEAGEKDCASEEGGGKRKIRP